MSQVALIAIHNILRSGEDIAPGKSFLESADEAEILIAAGAAKRAPVADAPAVEAPVKAAAPKGKKAAAAAPAAVAEPDLDDDLDV